MVERTRALGPVPRVHREGGSHSVDFLFHFIYIHTRVRGELGLFITRHSHAHTQTRTHGDQLAALATLYPPL